MVDSQIEKAMGTMDASIWDQILSRVETKVNRHSFYTWFKQTAFVADGGSSITVRVPNPLFRDWLTQQYSVVLAEALAEVRRPGASLVFVAEGAVVTDRIDAGLARMDARFDRLERKLDLFIDGQR